MELKLVRRVDEGTDLFDHFRKPSIERYVDGYSNGYVYTTAEYEEGECARCGPAVGLPSAEGRLGTRFIQGTIHKRTAWEGPLPGCRPLILGGILLGLAFYTYHYITAEQSLRVRLLERDARVTHLDDGSLACDFGFGTEPVIFER